MAFIHTRTKSVQIKIVYYGPAMAGKTANLIYIYNQLRQRVSAQLLTISAYDDQTLFFDFLSFGLNDVQGFDIKIRLYSVPGRSHFDAIRKTLLKGADGVVFVADASAMRKTNILSLKNLQTDLEANRLDIRRIPLVLQFNKSDLAEQGTLLLPKAILLSDLNSQLQKPYFQASAVQGLNVLATLKQIVTQTIASIENRAR